MKNAIYLGSIVLSIVAPLAGAQQMKPWPGDNPPPAAQTLSPIVGTPVKPTAAQPEVKSDSGSGGGNPASQIMQQMGSLLGGDKEVVGGGGGEGDSSGNSVDNAVSYKADSTCIKVGNAPCTPQKLVEGCSKEKDSGKLSFSDSSNGKINNTCEDIQMSEELANALDMNFARCAKQAAGINGGLVQPKIHHIGCISTDKNHLHTGSLHEDGRAIDIRAIELGGTIYDVQNNAYDPFFEKFRKCWADSANSLAGNCLTGNHPASVGDENAEHKDHHLHISMPLCPQVARAQGRKIALIELLFGNSAYAQEKSNYLPSKPTFKGKVIKLKNGGEAKVIVEDTGGEPVAADTRISLNVKCAGQTKPVQLEKPVEGCRYDSSEYDPATDVVTIRYFTSVMKNGMSECSHQDSKILKVTCPAAKSK